MYNVDRLHMTVCTTQGVRHYQYCYCALSPPICPSRRCMQKSRVYLIEVSSNLCESGTPLDFKNPEWTRDPVLPICQTS